MVATGPEYNSHATVAMGHSEIWRYSRFPLWPYVLTFVCPASLKHVVHRDEIRAAHIDPAVQRRERGRRTHHQWCFIAGLRR